MFLRWLIVVAAFLVATSAEAHRVALVIGQDSYLGGASATIGLPPLKNPGNDARSVSALLAKYGFEVISCDGKVPGCYDLSHDELLQGLALLKERANGSDMALIYFAGHGLASDEGNILTPIDAKVNCKTGAITRGVTVERFMQAVAPATEKLMILDACRDDPIDYICPGLAGKKLSFTRIEAGAMRRFLLVTSTQFGQQALDGASNAHSPFAKALLMTLEANSSIYFEQVMNEVARATYEAAQKQEKFRQIPGKVVGGEAPADCLAGKNCVGDPRMAALEQQIKNLLDNERASATTTGDKSPIIQNTTGDVNIHY